MERIINPIFLEAMNKTNFGVEASNLNKFLPIRMKVLQGSSIGDPEKAMLATFENEFGVYPTGETQDELEMLLLLKWN
jgi:hypothetical protein